MHPPGSSTAQTQHPLDASLKLSLQTLDSPLKKVHFIRLSGPKYYLKQKVKLLCGPKSLPLVLCLLKTQCDA